MYLLSMHIWHTIYAITAVQWWVGWRVIVMMCAACLAKCSWSFEKGSQNAVRQLWFICTRSRIHTHTHTHTRSACALLALWRWACGAGECRQQKPLDSYENRKRTAKTTQGTRQLKRDHRSMRAASAVSAGNEIKFMKGLRKKIETEKCTEKVIEFATENGNIHIKWLIWFSISFNWSD